MDLERIRLVAITAPVTNLNVALGTINAMGTVRMIETTEEGTRTILQGNKGSETEGGCLRRMLQMGKLCSHFCDMYMYIVISLYFCMVLL